MIETLTKEHLEEIMNVLDQAFDKHPMLPPGTPIKTTRALMRLLIDTFGSSGRSYFHGIRENGELVCVAFSVDSAFEPRGLGLLLFFWRILRLLGVKMTLDFILGFGGRPKYATSYLDLTLLGALPDHQDKGLGTRMLQHLYEVAEHDGYEGLILGSAKETPAFGFYQKQGFVVDKEISLSSMPVCLMRRDNR